MPRTNHKIFLFFLKQTAMTETVQMVLKRLFDYSSFILAGQEDNSMEKNVQDQPSKVKKRRPLNLSNGYVRVSSCIPVLRRGFEGFFIVRVIMKK